MRQSVECLDLRRYSPNVAEGASVDLKQITYCYYVQISADISPDAPVDAPWRGLAFFQASISDSYQATEFLLSRTGDGKVFPLIIR